MAILGGGNSLYHDSADLFHSPMPIFGADATREVARQPVIVLKVLEVIVEAGVVAAFNKIAQNRDEISCAYCLIIHTISDSQHTYF